MLMCSTRFRRFAVFLIDHTDPLRGDLHFAPNNMGATTVTEVRFSFSYSA
jgi:hypothetical protein